MGLTISENYTFFMGDSMWPQDPFWSLTPNQLKNIINSICLMVCIEF